MEQKPKITLHPIDQPRDFFHRLFPRKKGIVSICCCGTRSENVKKVTEKKEQK